METIRQKLEEYTSDGVCNITGDQLRRILSENIPKTKPKRGASGFLIWKSDNKEFIMSKIEVNGRGVHASKAGELWNQLSEDDKAPYLERADIDKQRYLKEMEDFKEVNIVSRPVKSRGRPKLSDEEKIERKKVREAKNSKPKDVVDSDYSDDDNNISNEPVNIQVEEVEVNVEEFYYNGKEYLLDTNTGDVYDVETEDIVGKKTGDNVKFL